VYCNLQYAGVTPQAANQAGGIAKGTADRLTVELQFDASHVLPQLEPQTG
jgi:hypothetical protein